VSGVGETVPNKDKEPHAAVLTRAASGSTPTAFRLSSLVSTLPINLCGIERLNG
jgi:hypothetical protein